MTDALQVDHVTHDFVPSVGAGGARKPLRVTQDVHFSVAKDEFVAIVGPSGCGKTTVLNMMAGLIQPSSGAVYRNGRPAGSIDPSVGYMFARGALMPWRDALANVELGLEFRGIPRETRRQRAQELLAMVGLADFAHAYPAELSQGMRQRVSLARTLAVDPEFLLMDEPFAALDAQTKTLMQDEFIRIWEGSAKTVVWVTRDLGEAVALADRVLVFSARPGRIKADVPIPLGRPRIVSELRFKHEYQQVSEIIWKALKDEVARI